MYYIFGWYYIFGCNACQLSMHVVQCTCAYIYSFLWSLHELYKTAAIFSLSNLYLKFSFIYVYATVDFICMGLLELKRTRNKRELQNKKKKLLPTGDSNTRPLTYEAVALSSRPRNLLLKLTIYPCYLYLPITCYKYSSVLFRPWHRPRQYPVLDTGSIEKICRQSSRLYSM